jgi:hypothetical protein
VEGGGWVKGLESGDETDWSWTCWMCRVRVSVVVLVFTRSCGDTPLDLEAAPASPEAAMEAALGFPSGPATSTECRSRTVYVSVTSCRMRLTYLSNA